MYAAPNKVQQFLSNLKKNNLNNSQFTQSNNLRHNMDVANSWIATIFELQGKCFPLVKDISGGA